MSGSDAIAVILGSAFDDDLPPELSGARTEVETPWGPWPLYRIETADRPAYLSFRHGLPHRLLPSQIPYRAQAWALSQVGCRALLATSSVGVLDPDVPLFEPLLVADVVTLDNRLPDGSACTVFDRPTPGQGHLVLAEGLLSPALSEGVRALADEIGAPIAGEVVFGYVGGPRTKTPAENRMWRALGAQVNSMTLAPELILAAELGIPCAAVVVGHKRSLAGERLEAPEDVTRSLERAREAMQRLVIGFARGAAPVAAGNHLYRFGGGEMRAEDVIAHLGRRMPELEAAGPPEPLAGGLLNHVWRVPGAPASVVVKHAPPYVATQPEVPFDPGRIAFEAAALRLFDSGGPLERLGSDRLRPPGLLDFDPQNAVLVMEDVGVVPDLGAELRRGRECSEICAALGRFVGALHATTAGDRAIARRFHNQPVQETRQEIQYRPVADLLAGARIGDAAELGDRARELGARLLTPGACLTMGDLWPPSVLIVPGGVRLVDWELCHYGNPAQDVAHFAAHLWMHAHRAGSEAAAVAATDAADAFLTAYRDSAADAADVLLDERVREDCAVHFACEILARTLGPFQRGYLYEGLSPDEPVILEAVTTAVQHLRTPDEVDTFELLE